MLPAIRTVAPILSLGETNATNWARVKVASYERSAFRPFFVLTRARNILEDAPDADAATGRSATLDGRGRGGWGRRGSASSEAGAGAGATGSLKRMAKEGEEKRRRGIFGGGKKKEKRKDREKQEDPIYENMESIAGEAFMKKELKVSSTK